MTKKKPKTGRSSVKYPALEPRYNLRTRQEEIADLASYKDKLNDEEKAWLNAFANEEICANFNHKGPKLNDETDPKVRSRIYTRNNERNRCIFTRETAQGALNSLEELDLDENMIKRKENISDVDDGIDSDN
jgi:hypothetical protein